MGRFGKYMACTNEECKNTRKILRNGEVAPPKEIRCHYLSCRAKNQMLISCCVQRRCRCVPGCQHFPEIA
ncbi:hypothetical protein ACLK14_07385 [Escherichia coli]